MPSSRPGGWAGSGASAGRTGRRPPPSSRRTGPTPGTTRKPAGPARPIRRYPMLVITMETGSLPGGRTRWAGRRHDDDRPDATSGVSSAELFDAVFHALHDGEQVALGFDCALTMPVPPDQGRASAPTDADALVTLAEPAASQPGLAELGDLLGGAGML